MFPQELVDRFVDEVAVGQRRRYSLPPDTRGDLRSCSLAARSFRSRSQGHLLKRASLVITRGQTESEGVRKLREVMETSETLRRCIVCLNIQFDAIDPLNVDDESAEWQFQDENLPHVIASLTEIRRLHIRRTYTRVVGWDHLSEAIKTALRNTRFTAPHLSSLLLYGISISPHDLAETWKSIKELTLQGLEMNLGEEMSENALSRSILEYRLEKLVLHGREFPLHLALQNRQVLGSLRQLMDNLWGHGPDSIRQTWNVIHITSESLVTLNIGECFITSIRPRFMTMDKFPSLRHLVIRDEIIGTKTFLDEVYPFFKLVNPTSTSKLESLELDLRWILPIGSNYSHEEELLRPSNGWSQLDALLTSSQYPHLRDVTMNICLSACWDLRTEEPERFTRLWNIYYHLESALVPLLHSSDSIDLDFDPAIGRH
ncbi:hypothetical protein M413DRAFT_449037 [Hebeloma cylindrosporum]|uniref:Uncharacterized protein n=1 Tax=Hebeloma cylindrosporum TaxID=76867 RepID=A0A0C3BXD3_HEBCY|nr:hypothetical protein M413DRAFT_449037 [Hebeloma cylindrosporum h7]